MLVMSGLSWNIASKARDRDWAPTVAAITLETALVEFYREKMLKKCSGACRLREDIEGYFLSIGTVHHWLHPSTGEGIVEVSWTFPDGYPSVQPTPPVQPVQPAQPVQPIQPVQPVQPVKPVQSVPEVSSTPDAADARSSRKIHADVSLRRKIYDAAVIKKDLNQVNVANTTIRGSKGKPKSVLTGIDGLTKNKLLWSSEPGVSSGTLETLAYHCISALSNVSDLFTTRAHLCDVSRLTSISNR